MKVELIAHTVVDFRALQAAEPAYEPHSGFDASDPDELAEFAGRNCYQSWNRPRPETATNQGYLANILGQGHESVLEHSSATFYVSGVSRALLTELERHRHISFSVISQRYVDATKLGPVMPPLLEELEGMDWPIAEAELQNAFADAVLAYGKLVNIFTGAGFPRKRAREAARSVMPNMTNSPMVVTGNFRAWRDIIKKRHHEAADAEIREFAAEILTGLIGLAPNSFQDLPAEPYGSE